MALLCEACGTGAHLRGQLGRQLAAHGRLALGGGGRGARRARALAGHALGGLPHVQVHHAAQLLAGGRACRLLCRVLQLRRVLQLSSWRPPTRPGPSRGPAPGRRACLQALGFLRDVAAQPSAASHKLEHAAQILGAQIKVWRVVNSMTKEHCRPSTAPGV